MCFSASASFIVSGGLLVGGIATQRTKFIADQSRPLFAIPYFFSAQQFSEGLVWLGYSGTVGSGIQMFAAYCFSFFAFVFWPIYMPHAIQPFESASWRVILNMLRWASIMLGVYYLWCFSIYSPLTVEIVCQDNVCGHLAYQFRLPYLDSAINYIYLAVTTIPFFLSIHPRVRWGVGLPILLSFPLTRFYSVPDSFPSTWCFFAAVVSISILISIPKPSQIISETMEPESEVSPRN